MDILSYAKIFFEAIEQFNPQIKSLIDLSTSLYTIGSTGVKVIQQGKQLITFAVGEKKRNAISKSNKTKSRQKTQPSEIVLRKKDVAIVVEISRPSVLDVVNYLESKKIDANLVVITIAKSRGKKPVNALNERRPSDWTKLVQEFSQAIDKIKSEVGSARIHIFISVPLALAFGLGSVWGTVDQAQVYHWKNSGGYAPLMKITRKLRFQE